MYQIFLQVLNKQLTVSCIFEGGLGTRLAVTLIGTLIVVVPIKGILTVFIIENLMVMVLHNVLEKGDPAVILKQTGVVQGFTMQTVIGMVPMSKTGMLVLQETQVQLLLMVQLLPKLLARERREVHISCLEMLWVSVRHEV